MSDLRIGTAGQTQWKSDKAVLVSVVMPAYNSSATIAEAIESVLQQTFTDWELLIVDDGSDDGTGLILASYATKEKRIRIISSQNREGAAIARNRAISVAAGQYIAFLDADDLWLHQKLQLQVQFMQQANAALTYTSFIRRNVTGYEKLQRVPATVGYDALLRGNVIGCLTAMYDTAQLGRVFMPEVRRRHDFAMWLDIVKNSGPAHGLNIPLAVYRTRAGSLSANPFAATVDTWRMYRDVIGLSRWHAGRNLASHLVGRALR